MDNTIGELNFQLDEPACGLITLEKQVGTINNNNWMTSTKFIDQAAVMAVLHARALLNTKLNDPADSRVKSIWLEIEDICAAWRRENNLEIVLGQHLLPMTTRLHLGQIAIFQLAKDGDLFFYLKNQGDKRTSDELSRRIESLFSEFGDSALLSITILYENHIGRAKDLLQTYASLQLVESFESAPHTARGKKTIDSARKGHEAVYGTLEEKEQIRQEYQEYVDYLYEKHPRWSRHQINKKAGAHFNVSYKRIERNTTDPSSR